jgi:DNA-binding XRE family transcriptional regulator
MSQGQLASKIGAARTTVVAIEAGERPIDVDKLILVMRALGCSFADLVWPVGPEGALAVEVGEEVMDPISFMEMVDGPPERTVGTKSGSGRPRPQVRPEDVDRMADRVLEMQEQLQVMRALLAEEDSDAQA